jgi:F420H(2)-dependent quinone reductase
MGSIRLPTIALSFVRRQYTAFSVNLIESDRAVEVYMAGTSSFVKMFLKAHAAIYRLTGGKIGGKIANNSVLLLTTTGRKSKEKRTMPLGYFKDGDNFIITASNSGAANNPAWYFNLKSDPHAVIEVGRDKLNVTAEQADPEQKKRLWAKLISIAPSYDRYTQKTTRDIPMMILHPE